ncbi:protein adenylyltransferase SelO [Sporosarcina sp. CAU 1771]
MSPNNIKAEVGWNFNNTYNQLPNLFFSEMSPNLVEMPKLVLLNDALAMELGLNPEELKRKGSIAVLAGNDFPEGAQPLAQAYAGHQFGNFTMLGDGRATLIGEQITPNGKRLDIQLKGSGRTPFSRGGDGRAALGPMLREYIMSEAMHGLGIPTTRSLAVVTTGESILRETKLPGAILTRIGESHLRFGTFQYAAKWGTEQELKELADYAIDRHFPEIKEDKNPYLSFLQKVEERHISLVVKWQSVGFIHGVMNTDNMTISGETIDYGPCAFMDTYDPATVFSSIDAQKRYAYGNQPTIVRWNLARFAETLIPLLHEEETEAIRLAQEVIEDFPKHYQVKWLSEMRLKLGLLIEDDEDEKLIEGLLSMMKKKKADYTNTFRALTLNQLEDIALFKTEEFKEWHEAWRNRVRMQSLTEDETYELMRMHNPAIIPRNHRVEAALEAAMDSNYEVLQNFLHVLTDPYAYSPEQEGYTNPPNPGGLYQTFCGT